MDESGEDCLRMRKSVHEVNAQLINLKGFSTELDALMSTMFLNRPDGDKRQYIESLEEIEAVISDDVNHCVEIINYSFTKLKKVIVEERNKQTQAEKSV